MNSQEREVINTAYEYIEKLIGGIMTSINNLREDDLNNGLKLITDIAEGINYIIQVVTLTNGIDGRVNNIEEINENLNEIVEGIENEDYDLVADVFKYEILKRLNEIRNALGEVVNN